MNKRIFVTSRDRGLMCVYVCVCAVAQLCLTLGDLMDCNLPGFSVLESFRKEYWNTAISSSRGSSQPKYQTSVSCIDRQILYHCATWEAPEGSFAFVLM